MTKSTSTSTIMIEQLSKYHPNMVTRSVYAGIYVNRVFGINRGGVEL